MMSAAETPFLTALDPRASVKGSRDPLGLQGIWTRLGRHVVGNLTTVSNSARDFRTTLLGYYFAEIVAGEDGPGTELATFLKWEQLAAYGRWTNNDRAFRGTEKVGAVFSEGVPVVISADRNHHILGNQKTYGLWGLYTVAARTSGMLVDEPARVSATAREFVESEYVPKLPVKWILGLLRAAKTRVDLEGRDSGVFRQVARCVSGEFTKTEREFYCEHLVYGGPEEATKGRQKQLASMLLELDDDQFAWSPKLVGALVKTATKRGADWEPLARYLERIRVCESVIAPMSMLFSFLLGLDGCPGKTATDRLKSLWGDGLALDADAFVDLRGEIGGGDADTGERWVRIAQAAASGSYAELVDLALQQNAAVMKIRGGAPWCTVENGRFVVKFRDEEGDPPNAREVKGLWRFPYFMDSLRTVAFEVAG